MIVGLIRHLPGQFAKQRAIAANVMKSLVRKRAPYLIYKPLFLNVLSIKAKEYTNKYTNRNRLSTFVPKSPNLNPHR